MSFEEKIQPSSSNIGPGWRLLGAGLRRGGSRGVWTSNESFRLVEVTKVVGSPQALPETEIMCVRTYGDGSHTTECAIFTCMIPSNEWMIKVCVGKRIK